MYISYIIYIILNSRCYTGVRAPKLSHRTSYIKEPFGKGLDGLPGGWMGASEGLEGGLRGLRPVQGGFKGAWEGLQGSLRRASGAWRWLAWRGAWRGLEKGFKGLQGGLRRAWRGIQGEGGLKGAWEGFQGAWFFFFARARCLSAGPRSWGLLADQQGIEPPPAICQRRQERRPTNWATRTPWGSQAGLRRASRGLEKTSRGRQGGFKPFSPSCPPLQASLEGYLRRPPNCSFVCGKGRPLLGFCDFAVSFGTARRSQKGTVNVLFFCSFTLLSCAFFPSDASWLSPGRSTRSIACCSDEWIS